MNAKQALFTGVIALSAFGALADDITIDNNNTRTSGLSRAEVKAQVLQARASGQLLPAGEGFERAPVATDSNVARSDIKAQVIAARSAGQLQPAGEGDIGAVAQFSAPSTRGRADVKAEVLAARKAGELIPAGEAYDGVTPTQTATVSTTNPLKALVQLAHHNRQSKTATE